MASASIGAFLAGGPNQDLGLALANEILTAARTVDIMLATLGNIAVIDAIIRAQASCVQVRVVVVTTWQAHRDAKIVTFISSVPIFSNVQIRNPHNLN